MENRRKIALDAAKAWNTEALLAEKQAAKQDPLDAVDAKIAREFADEDAESSDLA